MEKANFFQFKLCGFQNPHFTRHIRVHRAVVLAGRTGNLREEKSVDHRKRQSSNINGM
jgi:hypothetical protein